MRDWSYQSTLRFSSDPTRPLSWVRPAASWNQKLNDLSIGVWSKSIAKWTSARPLAKKLELSSNDVRMSRGWFRAAHGGIAAARRCPDEVRFEFHSNTKNFQFHMSSKIAVFIIIYRTGLILGKLEVVLRKGVSWCANALTETNSGRGGQVKSQRPPTKIDVDFRNGNQFMYQLLSGCN